MNSHNKAISIGKGVCILLMVIGHSACPKALKDWLYMFHMPFFFFISGYLLREKQLQSFGPSLKKKIKSLGIDLEALNLVLGSKTNIPFSTGCYYEEDNWILYSENRLI